MPKYFFICLHREQTDSTVFILKLYLPSERVTIERDALGELSKMSPGWSVGYGRTNRRDFEEMMLEQDMIRA